MSGRAYLFIAFMSTDDPGKDRTTARAAKRISEETAQGPGGSRIGTSSTPKEATKKGSSSHTADLPPRRRAVRQDDHQRSSSEAVVISEPLSRCLSPS